MLRECVINQIELDSNRVRECESSYNSYEAVLARTWFPVCSIDLEIHSMYPMQLHAMLRLQA